jgi:FkbM family methyltransferase
LVKLRLKSLFRRLRSCLFSRYATVSYAQEGEDIILQRIFGVQKSGFYIDIGAHHPHRFSNTYIFYSRGWRGVNIEPNPEMFDLFRKYRAKDINVKKGISESIGVLNYFMFDEPALNTFDKVLALEYEEQSHKMKKMINVDVCRLDMLLEEVVPDGVAIDFMTIDAEGHDFDVLKSNNWMIFRPRILLVEMLGITLTELNQSDMHKFIVLQGYELIAKTVNTFFYRDHKKI